MQRDAFRTWLLTNGNNEVSTSSRLSEAARVERVRGDLDEHFERDQLSTLLASLHPESGVDHTDLNFEGDIRAGLVNLRSAITSYQKFRRAGSDQRGLQADAIRLYAIAEIIRPARLRGDNDVVVRAKDVHEGMELQDAYPAVCSALSSSKLEDVGGVRLLETSEPAVSSTTTFRFEVLPAALDEAWARAELERRFGPPINVAQKMLQFQLADGRQLALERERPGAQIWLEDDGRIMSIPERLIERYAPTQGRHHGLPPRLHHLRPQGGTPRQVAMLKLADKSTFVAVLDAYASGRPRALAPSDEAPAPTKETVVPRPTNLILYGPPGTGKTYRTSFEAVRLCDGDAPVERAAAMARYQELTKAGRIQFVTFHQSYSYEDFVEGLRPVTGSDGAGFRLEPRKGVFREIVAVAEDARNNPRHEGGIDLAGRQFFKMSLGRAGVEDEIYDAAIAGGYISLGWGRELDWSDPTYANYDAILQRWRELKPDISGNSGDVSQLWRFRSSMRVGDIVIISAGNSQFRAIGEITGDYEFVAEPEDGYHHRRAVRWLRVLDAPLPVSTIHDGAFTQLSCYLLRRERMRLEGVLRVMQGDAKQPGGEVEQFVLIIDEINRANISKVFGELITLIEPDKRLGSANELRVTLPYSGDDFGVPENLHIVATMNTADRSIALLDTALRRRFEFEELMPLPQVLSSNVDGVDLRQTLATINERIEYLFDREHQIGHAYFSTCTSRADIDEVMRHRLIPLLTEYFFEDWQKVALVLGDADGAARFIQRIPLSPPAGLADQDVGEPRYRWAVLPQFAANAYDGF